MKTLIILKGLDKGAKLEWVKNENLENYFLDIDIIRGFYSIPDLQYPGKEILRDSFGNLVRKNYLEILITRLGKGCLVVVDVKNEVSNRILETLALIFGYTIFYVVWNIPQDYLVKPKQYLPSNYLVPKKDELEKDVADFLSIQLTDKLVVSSFSEVLDYWKKKEHYFKFDFYKDTILHISDLHSNYSLYKKLPRFKNYKYVVFHGDYIDGPEEGGSRELMRLAKNGMGKNVIWLEGNHELRLRKYLGCKLLKGDTRDVLEKTVPQDFLDTTAREFSALDIEQCRNYLQAMNTNLKTYAILQDQKNTYICTHSGLTLPGILDPRYIGNIIYGSREILRVDKKFNDFTKNSNVFSVHAHCKYNDWDPFKFRKVINIDPKNENQIIYTEQKKGQWKLWEIENSK